MGEEQWLACIDPGEMLSLVRDPARGRKLRLFACGCCRRVWNPFVTPFTIRVVTAAEAFADGEMSAPDLAEIYAAAMRTVATVRRQASPNASGYLTHAAQAAAYAARSHAALVPEIVHHEAALAAADAPATIDDVPDEHTGRADYHAELAGQADLLRDIFGNPFRSVGIELEWLTETVLALARGIYADRAFDRMPILADALQDAGCGDGDILGHCRSGGEHARGCWVVDLLLGKS